jgi:hypothetical protein
MLDASDFKSWWLNQPSRRPNRLLLTADSKILLYTGQVRDTKVQTSTRAISVAREIRIRSRWPPGARIRGPKFTHLNLFRGLELC